MTLALNSYQTMAVGILLYYLGKFLKARIKFLRTYCIPNPVIGGILFALLNLALHQSGVGAIKLDTVQQSFFMNMFFTSIGLRHPLLFLKRRPRRSDPHDCLRYPCYPAGRHWCRPCQSCGPASAPWSLCRFRTACRRPWHECCFWSFL